MGNKILRFFSNHHFSFRHFVGTIFTLFVAGFGVTHVYASGYVIGTTALLEGPTAGIDSVVLAVSPETATWTATTTNSWLHLSIENQSGTGSTNVVFSYDANPGGTRIGTLTIADQTLIITQAGSTYVATSALTTLNAGFRGPWGVAVDGSGNVFIADTGHNQLREWLAASNTILALTSPYSPRISPSSVAVDAAGGIYIADSLNKSISKWTSYNVTSALAAGFSDPGGVTVDGAGNVYIADAGNNVIKKWTAANSNMNTLVSGLNCPVGVAVDGAGNVYIADALNNAIKKWTAVNSNTTTLISGLNRPNGVAVDGSGNVYIADSLNNAIKKWTAANSSLTTLISAGLLSPGGLAVDGAGNLYVADTSNDAVKEMPNALVDAAPKMESADGGFDTLTVLPATVNLRPPFAPYSDQPWLTLTGITNGVVSFSFAPNLGAERTAHINLLGLSIPVTQRAGAGFQGTTLGTAALLEGPAEGSDSVVLAVTPANGTWTASSDVSWLHLSLANQSGTGSTNLIFSYEANSGATRTGTLTIAGQTLTVTQAGSNYVRAAAPATTLCIGRMSGIALGDAGTVYFVETSSRTIEKWAPTGPCGPTVTPVISGVDASEIAIDSYGNIYFVDSFRSVIRKWTAANNNVTTLVSGLNNPYGLAVDGSGNVYTADTSNNAIKMWSAANSNVTTVISGNSGLSRPFGVAVDTAGNVYIADTYNNEIKVWTAANSNITTLVSGLYRPSRVVVDGSGNVYFADSGNKAIKKWTAANGDVATLTSGLQQSTGLAVDGAGNVYLADTVLKELPRAFVESAKSEGLGAGSDALVVLPSSVNLQYPLFYPSTDQAWLRLGLITNGMVSFTFTTAPSERTAHITLLGQRISITQGSYPALSKTELVEGFAGGTDSIALTAFSQNAFWTATANASWLHLSVENQSGTGNAIVTFSYDTNPGLIRTGILTIAGQTLTVTQRGPSYSLSSSALSEGPNAGSDSVALTVTPEVGVWTAKANAPWLHLSSDNQSGTGSATVFFSFDSNPGPTRTGTITIGDQTLTITQQSPSFSLGATILYEGPQADSDSVALVVTSEIGTWSATANAPWLHLSETSQSGTGSTMVTFSFDANPGDTRVGTLTIAGEILTVTQAGCTYVAAPGLPHTFIDPSALTEEADADSYVLPTVLPPTVDLSGPLTPESDQPWLTITGITNGVVTFALSDNFGDLRRAQINLLGQSISITQRSSKITLGTTSLLEGPQAGMDSVVLAVRPNVSTWTATTSATWIHINKTNQSGTGSANIIFSYDANTNVTRTGTLTIAGQVLTVTQAGSNYIAASASGTLLSSGLLYPYGVAADGQGNVYIADTYNNAIERWTATSGTVTTLVSSGLNAPYGVATDGEGNVYIADAWNGAVKKWTATNETVTMLFSSGLNSLAVDGEGNVYIVDGYSIKKWNAANNVLSTLFTLASSGQDGPTGVAVDKAGNVYVAGYGTNAIMKWTAATKTLTVLASSGLHGPYGVAVDGAGNVYTVDCNSIQKWTAADNSLHTLVPGVYQPYGIAVDRTGNVFIADTWHCAIEELPYAFVAPTPKLEGPAAGSDVLPVVLPATANLLAPFAPTSDQPWLTISGVTNGVVSFTFSANDGPDRAANITLLGQTIPITQRGHSSGVEAPPTLVGATLLDHGVFRFAFSNNSPSASFTILSTTNLSLPLTDWTVVGVASNSAPSLFLFTTPTATNDPQRFYRVSSP